MAALTFAWDAAKNVSNRKKHGVSFEEARTVFVDDEPDVIRMLSARKANRFERNQYAARLAR